MTSIPLRNITAVSVAKALLSHVTNFGFPQTLILDQATAFMADVIQQLFSLAKISHRASLAYTLWSHGQVEIYNRSIAGMMRKFCLLHQSDWDKKIIFLTAALNDVPQESTGLSPNLIIFWEEFEHPSSHAKRGVTRS